MNPKNAKGQMAIFFVLIFQVLFILFAMTINVAMLVHDKINMQNSLDLAATYGAKKQAEVLNAIAHINYQMRQNYKLLAWRYRVLGSMTNGTPSPSARNAEAWCPGNKNDSDSCLPVNCRDRNLGSSIYPNNYCDIGFNVCVGSPIWGNGATGTHYCQNQDVSVPQIPTMSVVARHSPFNILVADLQTRLRQNVADICDKEKNFNWLVAQVFLSHFRLDQKDRKIMIKAIYDKSLKQGLDLDGQSIAKGAEKVFKKNLNYTNFKNLSRAPRFFNSLQGRSFEEFLTPINLYPHLYFMKFEDTCSGKNLSISDYDLNRLTDNYQRFFTTFQSLFKYNQSPTGNLSSQNLTPLSLGFKKLPSLELYFGARIEVAYSKLPQLFAPKTTSPSTLRVSAFAKAFGGRIGPGEGADPLIKPQIDFMKNLSGDEVSPTIQMQPNYSRYPGDKWGLIDAKLHKSNEETAFLKKTNGSISGIPAPYGIHLFDHLNVPTRADALSVDEDATSERQQKNPFHFLRMMELMAVFPDAFDITHYSIANNYMDTYFPKICRLIAGEDCDPKKRQSIQFFSDTPGFIRGDFGYPDHASYLQENLSKAKIASSLAPFFFAKNQNPVDLNVLDRQKEYTNPNIRYNYLVRDPSHFLTSWAPPTSRERYGNYTFPIRMFGKCYSSVKDSNKQIPTGCEKGGRSGYSVKLISCESVESTSPQPPDGLQAYCS